MDIRNRYFANEAIREVQRQEVRLRELKAELAATAALMRQAVDAFNEERRRLLRQASIADRGRFQRSSLTLRFSISYSLGVPSARWRATFYSRSLKRHFSREIRRGGRYRYRLVDLFRHSHHAEAELIESTEDLLARLRRDAMDLGRVAKSTRISLRHARNRVHRLGAPPPPPPPPVQSPPPVSPSGWESSELDEWMNKPVNRPQFRKPIV